MKSDIDLLSFLSRTLGHGQAIYFGHDGTTTHVVTWGETVELAAQAAAGANHIKKQWGWPDDTQAESAKVATLKAELAKAQATIEALRTAKATVWVIEGTEHERGWGCRPDGIVAFLSKEDAEEWIATFNTRFNTAKTAPNEYTTYSSPRLVEVGGWVREAILDNKYKCLHKRNVSELA